MFKEVVISRENVKENEIGKEFKESLRGVASVLENVVRVAQLVNVDEGLEGYCMNLEDRVLNIGDSLWNDDVDVISILIDDLREKFNGGVYEKSMVLLASILVICVASPFVYNKLLEYSDILDDVVFDDEIIKEGVDMLLKIDDVIVVEDKVVELEEDMVDVRNIISCVCKVISGVKCDEFVEKLEKIEKIKVGRSVLNRKDDVVKESDEYIVLCACGHALEVFDVLKNEYMDEYGKDVIVKENVVEKIELEDVSWLTQLCASCPDYLCSGVRVDVKSICIDDFMNDVRSMRDILKADSVSLQDRLNLASLIILFPLIYTLYKPSLLSNTTTLLHIPISILYSLREIDDVDNIPLVEYCDSEENDELEEMLDNISLEKSRYNKLVEICEYIDRCYGDDVEEIERIVREVYKWCEMGIMNIDKDVVNHTIISYLTYLLYSIKSILLF